MDCLAMTLRCLSRALSPLLLTLLTAQFGTAYAAERDGVRDEIARQDLALIQDQLAQIQRIVDRLEGRVGEFDPYTTRVFLDVPRLRRDLEAVAEGIDDVLEPPRLPPRQPAPLRSEERRVGKECRAR